MSTNNFTIEEMEDKAVKKSNIAKGIGITAAATVVSTGTAYAATHLHSDQPAEETLVTEEDVTAGMSEASQTETHVVRENVVTETHESHPTHTEHHVEVQHTTTVAPQPEPSVVVESSEALFYNEEEIFRVEQGTIDGTKYAMVDNDGDGYANDLYYDRNRDSQFTEDEHYDVSREGIHMTDPAEAKHDKDYVVIHRDSVNESDIYVAKNESGNTTPEENIVNNFDPNEKADEGYAGDFADNNEDYNNNEEVNDYFA